VKTDIKTSATTPRIRGTDGEGTLISEPASNAVGIANKGIARVANVTVAPIEGKKRRLPIAETEAIKPLTSAKRGALSCVAKRIKSNRETINAKNPSTRKIDSLEISVTTDQTTPERIAGSGLPVCHRVSAIPWSIPNSCIPLLTSINFL
jgi:hypothetical protein